jgi:hypothetical protein
MRQRRENGYASVGDEGGSAFFATVPIAEVTSLLLSVAPAAESLSDV